MTALTIGTFDLFHVGHVNLIQRAASFGELTVGVNSDRFVTEYKGAAPIVGEADRLSIVLACKGVFRTLLNDGPGRDLIDQVQPHLLVVGSDWHERGYLAQLGVSQEFVDGRGIAVVYVPRTQGVSSSAIRDRIS